MGDDEIIEVRQVQSFDDFPEDVQERIGDFEMGNRRREEG
jgi:hypothetical protein